VGHVRARQKVLGEPRLGETPRPTFVDPALGSGGRKSRVLNPRPEVAGYLLLRLLRFGG